MVTFLEDSNASPDWKRVARLLHRYDQPNHPDAFDDTKLMAIDKKNHRDDQTSFREMISCWLNMSTQKHTVGIFCDALAKANHGATAEKLYEQWKEGQFH